MTTVRGKLVTTGGQRRFFPMVSRSPAGALDSAPERKDDDERASEEALDAREAALDWREEANDEGEEDAQAKDRKRARDTRAIARDKRAHDRRAHDRRSARDEEMTDEERERAYPRTSDANPDHRNDWRPAAAGGPDNPAVDAALRLALDMRRRAASDRLDLDAIFLGRHPQGNASPAASVDVNAIFGGRA